jgi:predicted Zn-ribbon and HTH transcriptional regulator
MSRPPLEVADVIRSAGQPFLDRRHRWITGQHLKVLHAIVRCRTAALGGHRDQCSRCGYSAISYNSCRNRHCPKCQGNARHRWLEARRQELLPTCYVHVVFTLPREPAPLALQNKKVVYDLLFRTSAETLLEVARDPKHLGAQIGFFSVLHTWNQKLQHHPHVHCVLPAGGLSADHRRWIQSRRSFFLPVKVLSRVFGGKFVQALKRAFSLTIGWCIRSGPSAARSMFYAISGLTPTGLPYLTTGWLPWPKVRSRFVSQKQKALDHHAGRGVLATIPAPPAASGFCSYS